MATINSASGSSSTSAYSSRVTGMFSGLDTDSLVKSMVSTQQSRIDAVKQKQTYQNWTNEALSSITSEVKDFLNEYCSGTGSTSMLKAASYYSYDITSDSDSKAVTLSSSGAALTGDYTVMVKQLAVQASVSSTGISGGTDGSISSSNTATLDSLKFGNALKFDSSGQIKFSINGEEFAFKKGDTLQSMINTVNRSDAGVTMKYSRLSDGFTITANSGGEDSSVTIENISGNAFGTNSAFGISEIKVSSTLSKESAQKVSSTGTGFSDMSATLESLSFANTLTFDGSDNISFDIRGKTFTFAKTETLQGMLDTINNDATANVTMRYDGDKDVFTMVSDDGGYSSVTVTNISGNAFGTNSAFGISGANVSSTSHSVSSKKISSGGIGFSDMSATLDSLSFAKDLTFDGSGNVSFGINGKTFSFSKTTTLQDMLYTINNDTTANVTMKYNSAADGFTITSDADSSDSVSIKNISGNAFGTGSAFGIGECIVSAGQDSIAVINGTTITKDSNDYRIDDVNFKLNAVTEGTSEETIKFNVERDYSATTDAITKFVDEFNTLLTKLNSLVNEKSYSDDYPPLTDAQKEDMSEEQIKVWETKAKSGVLHNNSDLENLISNLKEAFFSTLGGTGKNTTAIGISTASYFSEDAGLFSVDTIALTEALKNNPEEVVSMFTNGSSSSKQSDMGLIYKMRNIFSKYNDAAKEAQEIFEDKIEDYDEDVDELEVKLDKMADRYYQQFSRMETALAALNSQASYISQLFTTA